MREVEGAIGDRNSIEPIGGSETCDYRDPKDKEIHGQFCWWGYEDNLNQIQCKYFKGKFTRMIPDPDREGEQIEQLIIKCSRRVLKCSPN